MVLRSIVLFLFCFLAGVVYLTMLCGRRYAATRDSQFRVSHEVCATGIVIVMLMAIGAVEAMKLIEGSTEGGMLLFVHLTFAIPFFVLVFLLRFWITGLRARRLHRPLAYLCFLFYAIAFSAGAAMLLGFSL